MQKYGYAPDAKEEKTAETEDIYNFYWLIKVKQHTERCVRADIITGKKLRKKLREPLKIGEKKMLALGESLKKKIMLFCILPSRMIQLFSLTTYYQSRI